jgi:dihydrofolate synthase/folylpolyglutamate synthase
MGYRQAYQLITSLKRFGGGRGLDAVREALESIGNPQHNFSSIHIGGTNGKGSVSSIIESVLLRSGYTVGLYTSPHILKINERIRLNGRMVDNRTFASAVEVLVPVIRRNDLSFFEALTLVAFKIFGDAGVDIGVIEVGLGGRLDATNLVKSILSVVTTIDYDHVACLGDNLKSIAREKLGIARPGIPLVTGLEQVWLRPVFEDVSAARMVPLYFLDDDVLCGVSGLSPEGVRFTYRSPGWYCDDLFVPLAGAHQARNAALAVRALELLDHRIEVGGEDLKDGLAEVALHGRFEIVRRAPHFIVLDVFHNRQGARVASRALGDLFKDRDWYLIIGVAGDKDIDGIVDEMAAHMNGVITVRPSFGPLDREVGPSDLAPAFRGRGVPVSRAPSMRRALSNARSVMKDGDVLLVGGSFRTVAAAVSCLSRH